MGRHWQRKRWEKERNIWMVLCIDMRDGFSYGVYFGTVFFLFLCCHCWSEAICGHWRYWISERALLWTLDTHAHMRISSLLLSRSALIVFMWHSCFNNIYRECRQYGDFMSYHKICITRYGNMVMMRVCVCVNCLHNQTSKITRTHYNS